MSPSRRPKTILALAFAATVALAAQPRTGTAQDDAPSLGEALVLRDDEPSSCGLMAAGIMEHAVQSMTGARSLEQAGLVLAQAPVGAYADLGCNVILLQDMLDCLTVAWVARLRGGAGMDAPLRPAALRCALDPGRR